MSADSTLSPVARLVRRHDRDRFLTALFAPADRRPALFALYAFNYEVAKTREIVSEATLGRIRLQWWRESLDAVYAGGPVRHHEVVEPLAAAIHRHGLSRRHFDRLIDARERDLEDEPPADVKDYAEASAAPLVLLALEALDVREETALAAGRAIGTAYALAGLLRAVPFHARQKRLYLPFDRTSETGRLAERELFELRTTPELRRAARENARLAAAALDRATASRAAVPRAALPALLPAVLARADLARLARAGYDPLAPSLATADPWRSWRLTVAALRGRY
jgi:NADH dehydrogenase [ubiquinone] 1 alpha subcomplex assembly factor 6